MSDSAERHVHIGRDVSGQVVVGDHNVIIQRHGSSSSPADGPPPEVRPRTRPAGRPLPDPTGPLIGREEETARVRRWLEQGEAVGVHGVPGIGRSALLRRVAEDQVTAGADVVFLPAAGLAVEDIVQELFQACYDTDGYRPTRARLRRLMGSIQALVVVDDFEGPADDLEVLLDAIPAGRLLVSSVDPVMGAAGRSLELGGLAGEPALRLVGAEAGRDLTEEEQTAARRLFEASGGHPGVLARAAAAVRTGAATTLTADAGALTRALAAGLAAPARTALGVLLALADAPLSAAMATVLTGSSDSGEALAELERARLAASSGTRYRLAADPEALSVDPPEPAGYAEPLTEWARSATPRETAEEAPVILRVLAAAVSAGRHEQARDLARAAAPALGRALRWGAWRQVLQLGLRAAESLGAAEDVAYFTHELQVRNRVLGLTAGVAAGAAAGGGLIAAHGALATGAKATAGKVTGAAAGHPALIAGAAAVVVAGAVVGVGAAMGGSPERPAAASGPAYSAPAVPIKSSRPVPVRSSRRPGPADLTLRPSRVAAGETFRAIATGFQPGEVVSFSMTSAVTSAQIDSARADDSGRAEIAHQIPRSQSLADSRPYPISAEGEVSHRTAHADLWVIGARGTGDEGGTNGGDGGGGKTGGNGGGPSCTPDRTGPVDFGDVPYQDNGEPAGFRLVSSGTTCEGALATGSVHFTGKDADLFRIGRSTACPDTLPVHSSRCFVEVLLYATRATQSVSASLVIPGVGTPDREIRLLARIGPATSGRAQCSAGPSCPSPTGR
ncbi:hypothetical protein GCM10023196_016540 [Actinoallomurus vinaceus]|uniref:AAA+ ATPase domain-containing protein n=1 Tax=Actinoallomurus vinaceus TaxID=1080074 RepID=A0ABP8U5H5_9ACTN